MKRIAALFLVFCMVLSIALAQDAVYDPQPADVSAPSLEGPGYATPEEAVQAYVAYWSEGNIAGMISVYAIEHYVDHFQTEEYLAQMRCFTSVFLQSQQVMSTVSSMRDIEYYTRLGNVAAEIRKRYLVAHWPYYTTQDFYNTTCDVEPVMASIEALNEETSCTVSLVRMITPEELVGTSYARCLEQRPGRQDPRSAIGKKQAYLGAEQLTDCAFMISIDGKDYVMTMDLASWDGRWYAISTGTLSAILGIDANYGGMLPADALTR